MQRWQRNINGVNNLAERNKTAFVTGGGFGIGQGIAIELAKEGYDVAITYLGSEKNAENTIKQIEKLGRRAVMIRADISKYENIINMFEEFKKFSPTLDVFVNNAGVTEASAFLDTTEEMFDNVCAVDYKGAYFCMQTAAKIMVEKNIKGSLILISSNHALTHFADVSLYASVKAAAVKSAEHMAIELAKYGIRVNTIAPGWTDTGAKRLGNKEDTFYKVPLQKWAEVEEVAKSVAYLASDAAASITGATLVIDNGARLVSDKRERYGF